MSLNPGRSSGRIFFSRVNLCADSYLVSVPPRVIAVARKRPTESLWIDPHIKSGISVSELISTLKKKKKRVAGGERMVEHSPQIRASEDKVTTTAPVHKLTLHVNKLILR